MRNCFILAMPDQPYSMGKIGIADLTGMDEMVPDTMTITRINIPEAFRGRGFGSELLETILAEADREGIVLSLEIMPSGPLNYTDLESWYMRHGFEESDYEGIYIRQPKG